VYVTLRRFHVKTKMRQTKRSIMDSESRAMTVAMQEVILAEGATRVPLALRYPRHEEPSL